MVWNPNTPFQPGNAPQVQGPRNPGAMPGFTGQGRTPVMPTGQQPSFQNQNFLQLLVGARPGGIRLPYLNPGKYVVMINDTCHTQTQNTGMPILRVEATVLLTLDANEAFQDRKSQRPGNEFNWVALKDPKMQRDFYARDVADFAEAVTGCSSEEIFTEQGVPYLIQAFNSGEFDYMILEVDSIPQITKTGKPIAKVHWVSEVDPEAVLERVRVETPHLFTRIVSGEGQARIQNRINLYRTKTNLVGVSPPEAPTYEEQPVEAPQTFASPPWTR